MPPTILTFVSWYFPGFKAGGPMQSIANLVDHLGDEYTFRIVTRDRDMGDGKPYVDIHPGTWHTIGKARVYYLPPELQHLHQFVRLLRKTPHDILYLNSFFDLRFTTLPLLARCLSLAPRCPTVLALRGEFSIGALTLKANKKRAFTVVSRAIGLHSGLTWQASTEHEATDIRRTLGSVARDIRIASNLPRRVPPIAEKAPRNPGDPLRVVFLSRISPKKNLLFALEVLAYVRAPLKFSIYGPKEDSEYWRRCESAIKVLPPNIRAEYCGPVNPEQVIPTLSRHDLFFLPTLGENYGHVIAEAFQAGLPVLLSDQTPWRDLDAAGLGRDLPLEQKEAFARYIEEIAAQSPEQAQAMRQRVKARAMQIADVSADVSANRRLFEF